MRSEKSFQLKNLKFRCKGHLHQNRAAPSNQYWIFEEDSGRIYNPTSHLCVTMFGPEAILKDSCLIFCIFTNFNVTQKAMRWFYFTAVPMVKPLSLIFTLEFQNLLDFEITLFCTVMKNFPISLVDTLDLAMWRVD